MSPPGDRREPPADTKCPPAPQRKQVKRACIKNKYRARLCVEHDRCVALSKTEPRIDDLVKAKQAQPSH